MKYKIFTPDGVKEIDGEVLTAHKRKVIVHKSYEHGYWFVHDYASGLIITASGDKPSAGRAATILLKATSISDVRLKREFADRKLPFPLNHEN